MLLLAAFALFAGSAVQAATINVDVGANGLTYTPSNVTAQDKDTILFTLYVPTRAFRIRNTP